MFSILYSVWVTLTHRYWLTSAKRRRVGARGQESQAARGRPSRTQRSTGSPPGRTDSPAARRNPGSALGADPGCLRAARLDLGSHSGGAPLVPPSIAGHDSGWGASVAAPRTTAVRTHFPVAGESSHSSWQ